MEDFFEKAKDWLEVWALFIPLAVLFVKPKQPGYLHPVIIYIIVALVCNLLIDISWKGKSYYHFPEWFKNNNHFYNIHSVARLLLFAWFFVSIPGAFPRLQKGVPVLFIVFLLVNFIYLQPFWMGPFLNTRLHAVEAGVLLVYCLQYYFILIQREPVSYTGLPAFWVVTGLSIFVVVSFPIYLFYKSAALIDSPFVVNIWQVQKIAYLVLCLFTSIAFYVSDKSTVTNSGHP